MPTKVRHQLSSWRHPHDACGISHDAFVRRLRQQAGNPREEAAVTEAVNRVKDAEAIATDLLDMGNTTVTSNKRESPLKGVVRNYGVACHLRDQPNTLKLTRAAPQSPDGEGDAAGGVDEEQFLLGIGCDNEPPIHQPLGSCHPEELDVTDSFRITNANER
jgi:hypothetical protein